jgi:endonuclease/exonuclease/phosphatase family metal-dependent hydrolase
VALQEVAFHDVDGRVLDQPLELGRLTERHVRYGAVHAFRLVEPDTGRAIGTATWGNALLTREPVRDGFTTGLPVGADDDLVEPVGSPLSLAGIPFIEAPYGTREPRCAVGGRVAAGGAEVAIVTTHLAYAGSGQRAAQADALVSIADDQRPPVVILGDLNAPIESPELRSLTSWSGVVDAFEAVGVPPGDPRRNSCGSLAIDHIIVRGLAVDDCRVATEADDASDHLPVVATLRAEVG